MDIIQLLEVVAGIVVIVWVTARIDALSPTKGGKTQQTEPATGASAPAAASAVKAAAVATALDAPARRPLDIAGTERLQLQNLGFLRGFAVRAEHVTALVRYEKPGTLASFPAAVQDTLKRAFEEGGLKGLEVVGVLFRDEALAPGHSVYIAEVSPPGKQPYLTGFVAKTQ